MDRRFVLVGLVAAGVLGGGLLGEVTWRSQPLHAQEALTQPTIQGSRRVPASEEEVRLSYAPVVKLTAPAVVNVYASRTVQAANSPLFDDPFFQRFFDDFGPSRQRVQQSLGSGVIVDASGIVVTNVHVIAEADAVKVALSDGQELEADILLKDERSDLAVLRLREGDGPFPFVELADSDWLEVGDLALAIGNPFGVGQTVTSGIISGLARTHVSPSESQYFIQTDAAINPGNSGGALVDMTGRLVGINTAIFSRSGGSDGIGFAIPSNMVRVVVEAARTGSPVRRPWIGASYQALTPEIAAALGLARARGALITETFADGPAALAGMAPGDLVVALDGAEIDDPIALNYRLATAGLGRTALFTVLRNGERQDLQLELIPPPETVPRNETEIVGYSPFVGARVANLSPAVAEELGHSGAATGVIVVEVAPGSVADQVGLRRGDVVLNVNGAAIDRTDRLAEISAQRSRVWRFAIERDWQILQSVLGG